MMNPRGNMIPISETRSRMMASVKQKDTKPELVVRRLLHSLGFRYKLHDRKLPGTPDISLPRYKVVIFVHGCFWHYHQNCKYSKVPSHNSDLWREKLEKNVLRDVRKNEALTQLGWRVITVWECSLRGDLTSLSEKLTNSIKSEKPALITSEIPPIS